MFVNTELLHSGRASLTARPRRPRTRRSPVAGTAVGGMFGGFAAAEAFHDAVSAATLNT